MKPFLLSLFCVLAIHVQSLQAQLLPAYQPEQEPCNALQICGSFYTPYSYQGEGTTNNLPSTACGAGEDNSVWFKIEVVESGVLVFRIVPVLTSDDYDWALLDATGKSCSEIGVGDVIRCNFNQNVPISVGGQTGLNMTSTTTSVYAGTTGQNFCRYVDVEAGDIYYLMINNFGVGGTPTSGFNLDFDGTTATLWAPPPAAFQSVLTPVCNIRNQVRIKLSEAVLCSSIASDGSDFSIAPFGMISAAIGVDCTAEGYTDEVTIYFSGDLPPANYTLSAALGTDGNTLLNLCEVPLMLPDALTFNVYDLRDTVNRSICSSQLPYSWNGITVTAAGIAAATFTTDNIAGCDSITVLNLEIVDTIESEINLTLCTNQLPYVWNGITVNAAGFPAATYTTTNAAGCDSIALLMLTVTPPKWTTQHLQVCSYDLPYVWNGTTIPADASTNAFYDTFATSTATGCDSFTILNLTVHTITPTLTYEEMHACGYFDYQGQRYMGDTLLSDTLRAASGCDSIYLQLQVYVHSNEPTVEQVPHFGCDSFTFRAVTYLQDTTITDSFRNIYGCDSLVRHHNIMVENFELVLRASADTIVAGEYVVLTAQGNVGFEVAGWSPTSLFSVQRLYEQVLKPSVTEDYIVTATSLNGCVDTGQARVVVVPLIPDFLMPNAFSPNGDGLNDLFAPKFFHESGYVINHFLVYNRWGNLVFKVQNSRVKGWDGTNQNTMDIADAGVYFYYIEVEFVNKQKVTLKGDVTLIR